MYIKLKFIYFILFEKITFEIGYLLFILVKHYDKSYISVSFKLFLALALPYNLLIIS
jgi:hypothetical protein